MMCFSFNHGFIAATARTMVIIFVLCVWGLLLHLVPIYHPIQLETVTLLHGFWPCTKKKETKFWPCTKKKKKLKRHVSSDEPVRSNLIGYIAVGYSHNGPQTCRQRTRSADTT